ncbi:TPA: hypothetical protein ACH3X3_009744 [Trebouxia sp. C0006]
MMSDMDRYLLNCANMMACACLVRPAESDLDTHPHILRHPGRSNVLITDRRQCHGIRRLGQFACMLAYVKEQVLLPTCIEDSPEESTDSNWEVNKHQALNVQGRQQQSFAHLPT